MQNTEAQEERKADMELLQGLEEALHCTTCQIAVTQASMADDIQKCSYITSHYPPFFLNNNSRDDNISPTNTHFPSEDPSFWKHISVTQRERYYELVEQALNHMLDETKDINPEVAVLFAHYQIDFHIRQHYLALRGVLTFCRNADDMQQLRHWQWKMHDMDNMKPVHPDHVWPLSCKHVGWPEDKNLEMMHQTLMWKRAWPARRKRVAEVRARWAIIMEERRKQREMLLRKQKATITVRVYCRGELMDVRELKRITHSEPTLRLGRLLQSSGV
ncbi:uncharacterized protein N7496_004322 [Penicillium cataractarum]|uniref:Uncharacterized protein n=1 Tax=Penicillium cataractarum TaxID=2100454 RepID=A0A9W9VID6_9EURO|nr:uncharacterized protein N7496_004322 [Penicillium cataractarum]KAJ5381894.1 hypothetical protein N7496_004322 [Penicillium cataractarum]